MHCGEPASSLEDREEDGGRGMWFQKAVQTGLVLGL